MDYKARFYSPSLDRFIQPDTLIPGAENPRSWNRFGYANNNPILYNDPTGHCPTCFGAAIGGIVGASLFIISETQESSDGFDLKSDWVDLVVAAGTGALAGALIMTPGTTSAGIALASSLAVDHAVNIGYQENFSATDHITTGALGLLTGGITGGLPLSKSASLADAMYAKGLAAASITGLHGMFRRRFGLVEDTDPMKDIIEMAVAGVGEAAGSGVSNALGSEAAGGLVSTGSGLTAEIINKNRNQTVRPPITSSNRNPTAILKKLERMERELR